MVSAELRMLDEPIAAHEVKEILLGREEVFSAMFFALSWGTGGVYIIVSLVFSFFFYLLGSSSRGGLVG